MTTESVHIIDQSKMAPEQTLKTSTFVAQQKYPDAKATNSFALTAFFHLPGLNCKGSENK